MIKVSWDVEEIVALIDIYRRVNDGIVTDINAELMLLSKKLHKRASILKIDHDEKYRNLNGMNMMYQNVVFVASGGNKGMSNVSSSIHIVFEIYQKNIDAFNLILKEFNAYYGL